MICYNNQVSEYRNQALLKQALRLFIPQIHDPSLLAPFPETAYKSRRSSSRYNYGHGAAAAHGGRAAPPSPSAPFRLGFDRLPSGRRGPPSSYAYG